MKLITISTWTKQSIFYFLSILTVIWGVSIQTQTLDFSDLLPSNPDFHFFVQNLL